MKITTLEENKITFENGHVLAFYHDQNCCETVYADCENIQAMSHMNTPIYKAEFDENLKYEMAEGIGIYLINKSNMKYLISCYNKQNGYYSDKLEAYLFNKEQFFRYAQERGSYYPEPKANEYLWYCVNVEKKDQIY
jgi:hypothetical protein